MFGFSFMLSFILKYLSNQYLSELLAEHQKLRPFMQVLPNCSRLLNQGDFFIFLFYFSHWYLLPIFVGFRLCGFLCVWIASWRIHTVIVFPLDILVGFEHIQVTTIDDLVVLPRGWLVVLGCNSTFTHKFTAFSLWNCTLTVVVWFVLISGWSISCACWILVLQTSIPGLRNNQNRHHARKLDPKLPTPSCRKFHSTKETLMVVVCNITKEENEQDINNQARFSIFSLKMAGCLSLYFTTHTLTHGWNMEIYRAQN